MGWEDADACTPCLVEQGTGTVKTHWLGVEEGAEVRCGVVGAHVRTCIGELGESRGVRGGEAVGGESFDPLEDLEGLLARNSERMRSIAPGPLSFVIARPTRSPSASVKPATRLTISNTCSWY